MEIKLNKPFAANSAVDEFDVRQIKKILNRLGYYQPYEKTGITGIPDAAVFTALKTFQKDQGIKITGTAKPDDVTVKALNDESSKKKNGKYIWRTVGDGKVRESHAELEGTVRDLSDSPDPGEEFNCRCWAEPVSDSDIEKEKIPPPPPKREEPKIPGTNIPDHGVPEQGWPDSTIYDPYKPGPTENPDPAFDKKPPRSPFMPEYKDVPSPPREIGV